MLLYLERSKTRAFIQCPGPLTHAFDQCIHLSVTWTGNHRNVSAIFSYNPRISPAPHARTGVTRSYLIYALLRVRMRESHLLVKRKDYSSIPSSGNFRACARNNLSLSGSDLGSLAVRPVPRSSRYRPLGHETKVIAAFFLLSLVVLYP